MREAYRTPLNSYLICRARGMAKYNTSTKSEPVAPMIAIDQRLLDSGKPDPDSAYWN